MPTTHSVEMFDYRFEPPARRIEVGDSVVWINRGQHGHSAVRNEDPSFFSGLIAPGNQSAPKLFERESGDEGFAYVCGPHPWMEGIIIVNARTPAKQE
jgi:plastocyanin